ncbi:MULTISPECIES: fumarylacetoacetate hydrolase family protein [unclassified Paenibacillus]|uniref:fumarylacetoacetate hydrolase family protein n=1 Tax=unclassified Paenibacillus TaxID=185978 RepID=UPI001AEA93D2|nr:MULTISPECIES: fumarylacetoacetate hydrolase family protein [unclassified Paenibacillus]MBP1157019.1 2-keto-4-pentenoate hydratase/2-oxohepta-3-ene-1,7-dioic acid hydratase in catechol pathway [Paenibacillus sp. PvP091]MBP1172242.1 2-keto-4-pentenoate hydratase/2-oxohepta-3-ene-1,7-dioic acid hydratase in catechol pathway [Paenibacillus sp. PvR098]MBP2438623.1 2-keto-4-pentenoate hydratase/2-oxohepta-3-ene-1,7-dioic acid hydratase in catechol pathway [Paenibacillus sp. PvP052]
MKILRYLANGFTSYGLLEGNDIIKIEGSIFGAYQITDQRIPLSEVRLLSPITPGKIVAIGLNYKKHAEEVNKPLPDEPMMFLVSPTAVIGPGDAIQLVNPEHRTEHEGELAIVIGKQAAEVSVTDALDYVFGYTCCNDVSDRHLQKKDGQFTRAKSFATYKPLGPSIVTDINPDEAPIRVRVNGEIRQESNTSDMIFSTAEIVSFVSQVMTLEPGDVIITGTPSGVSPLKDGDIVEVEVAGIGSLTNTVTVK